MVNDAHMNFLIFSTVKVTLEQVLNDSLDYFVLYNIFVKIQNWPLNEHWENILNLNL